MGTVFKVVTNGALTTLVAFNSCHGASPYVVAIPGLALGQDGNFYGTTGQGGITNSAYPYGMGTVFRLLFAPIITLQPQSQTNNPGATVMFLVGTTSLNPMGYQWQKNGTNLADGGNISGSLTGTLIVTNLAQSDLGSYTVITTNAFGSATSSIAMLVMPPYIKTPFSGAVTYWGKDATLSVVAWGTGPLSYQWFKDGVTVLNATNQELTLTSIQFTNAGLYSVVVTSALGSATNAPAQVVVNPAGVSLGFSPTLTINGVAGYSYIIQSAPNLTDTNAWVTRTNLTLTQPVQLWVDTNVDAISPFNSKYFYRVLPGQ
jgi:hypothetical protein